MAFRLRLSGIKDDRNAQPSQIRHRAQQLAGNDRARAGVVDWQGEEAMIRISTLCALCASIGLIVVTADAAVAQAPPSTTTEPTPKEIWNRFSKIKDEPDVIPKEDKSKKFKSFWSALDLLNEDEKTGEPLSGTVHIGFNSDETGAAGDSLLKVNSGATLKRGTYPAELDFKVDITFQVKGGLVQQDVTQIRANYQYHTNEYMEFYTFVERFSDNFIGIQQRYETGVGTEFSANFGGLNMDDFDKAIDSVRDALRDSQVQTKLKNRPPSEDDYPRLKNALRRQRAVHVTRSRVQLGVALSVFAELEQGKITAVVPPQAPATEQTTKDFTLNPEHRFRWTVRPTFRWRPSKDIEVSALPYFKLPLDGPRYITVGDREQFDYRLDFYTTVKWDLDKSATGNEKVALELNVNRFYDNVPPSIPQSTIDTELAAGRALTQTTAQRHHNAVSLNLNVTWGE